MGEQLKSSPSAILEKVCLPSPAELKDKMPLSVKAIETVVSARRQISDIIHNRSPRKLVLIGPCSIHDPKAVLEYAERMAVIAPRFPSLFIVMRAFFEKPRGRGIWTGFINDPNLDCSFDIQRGVSETRRVLTQILELGVPCCTEMLSLISMQYFDDCISFANVGARTAESPLHREVASGLTIPIGFKNSSSGNVDVAIEGILATSRPRGYIGVDNDGRISAVKTAGNPNCCIILRGSYTAGPNYSLSDINNCASKLSADGINTRSIIVDATHGNSSKCWTRQLEVAKEVASYEHPRLAGIMVESFLEDGAQITGKDQPLRYGLSITDECVGWEKTVDLLGEFDRAKWGSSFSNGHANGN